MRTNDGSVHDDEGQRHPDRQLASLCFGSTAASFAYVECELFERVGDWAALTFGHRKGVGDRGG